MDDATYRPGDWLIGRSTYFDAPVAWKAKFEPHLFGDVHGNGCGSFTNKGPGLESNSNFTLPLDAVAAVADFDPRFYEGVRRSCYELGCITGPILNVATRERTRRSCRCGAWPTDDPSTTSIQTRWTRSTGRTRRERVDRSERRSERVGVHAVLERVADHIRHDRGRLSVPVLVGRADHLLRPRAPLRPQLLGARAPRSPAAGEDDAQVQARPLRHQGARGRSERRERAHGRRGIRRTDRTG